MKKRSASLILSTVMMCLTGLSACKDNRTADNHNKAVPTKTYDRANYNDPAVKSTQDAADHNNEVTANSTSSGSFGTGTEGASSTGNGTTTGGTTTGTTSGATNP
jgi:hypothetical protein